MDHGILQLDVNRCAIDLKNQFQWRSSVIMNRIRFLELGRRNLSCSQYKPGQSIQYTLNSTKPILEMERAMFRRFSPIRR